MNAEMPGDSSGDKDLELVRLNTLVTHETGYKLRFLMKYNEISATETVRRSIAIYNFGLSLESKDILIIAQDGDTAEREAVELPTDLETDNDKPDISLNCNLNIPTRDAMDEILLVRKINSDGELIDKAVEYYLRLVEKAINGYSLVFEEDGRRREIVIG